MSDGMNRRKFLKVLGVTGGGTAAMAGCSTDRVEKLIPYLVPVEDQIPGKATWYASTCRECAAGCGLHVRVREGRAVKLEGNPGHPVNQGRLCARAQANLQGTYNPDRVRQPMAKNDAGAFEPVTWDDALQRVADRLGAAPAGGVWFLTGHETGSFDRLLDAWAQAAGARRVVYEPFGYEALRHANQQVFGTEAVPAYRLADAEYVLSFGADFLETWLSPLDQARGFAASHGYHDGAMGRYVHIEPRMSMTAMSADEWIAPVPGSEAAIALAMAQVILADGLGRPPADASRVRGALAAHTPEAAAEVSGVPAGTIRRLAHEFTGHPSVALPGGVGAQHAEAHRAAAAVNVLNYVAGNVGRTVEFGAALNPSGSSSYAGLRQFTDAAGAGQVAVLFVHGANPAYATPGAGGAAAEAVRQVPFTVSFSRFLDETTMEADLILPDHDPLEQWNDSEPRAGVWSLQQPVMMPVFDTRQAGDVLLDLARRAGGSLGRVGVSGGVELTYEGWVQGQWRAVQRQAGDRRTFDDFWREALQRGGVWTDVRARTIRLAGAAAGALAAPAVDPPESGFTLIAYPSLALYDGRAANRPWLQELPDPVTKMTWGTWVEMHPDTGADLGIAEGDIVTITSGAGSIEATAYLYPGIRPDTVAVPTGQGHRAFGRWAEGRGANVYALLPSEPTAYGGVQHQVPVTVVPTGRHERAAKTEGRNRQMGRGIAQAVTMGGIAHGALEHPFHVAHAAEVPEREAEVFEDVQHMYKEATEYGPYAFEQTNWGMTIDLARCTGCSACVTACSAENNVPFVGPAGVRRGREMMWIRIERYFEGGEDGEPLEARFLPMMCQHCAKAPCEPVCPVFAAYQTPDGMNGQIYNRCVGTRYCGNNCPYKVRYFNWFDHQQDGDPHFAWPEPMNWLLNPDVTVRSKGVMEKCTFCVQRIRGAQHDARVRGTPLTDGAVMTACQQTCPSGAIEFGNLNDAQSRVAQGAADPRGYHVLGGLNTAPSVTYLQKVRNLGEAEEA